jgi:hypothetical protein
MLPESARAHIGRTSGTTLSLPEVDKVGGCRTVAKQRFQPVHSGG